MRSALLSLQIKFSPHFFVHIRREFAAAIEIAIEYKWLCVVHVPCPEKWGTRIYMYKDF